MTQSAETPPTEDRHQCPRCYSRRWVGYGTHAGSGPVKAQCVPCGQVYAHPEPVAAEDQHGAAAGL